MRLLSQVRRRPEPDGVPPSVFPGKQPVQGMMSIVKFRSSPYLCFMRVTRIDFSPDVIHCRIYSESRPRATDAQHAASLIGRAVLKSFGAHGFQRGPVTRKIPSGVPSNSERGPVKFLGQIPSPVRLGHGPGP